MSVAGFEESPEVIVVSGVVAIWVMLVGRIEGSVRVSQVGIGAKARTIEIGPSVSNGNVERN
ncbi:hypothetical protein IIC65_03915 [Candidatus Sumerlaeota bacterium]|nr:hypothetical protein [Candidatus Sumerlaeota bacterium]